MSPSSKFTYRFDIDGLRAIAVLAVLGFHIAPWTLPGGFVGVDVFFVISGFLITSILWRSFEAETFTFASFYTRRIKRLFPALFVLLLTCSVVEYFVGLPDEAFSFGVSAISSAFYVSNHYFLSLDDYFDESLEINPLLHTWSLSVEEQFYIFFPALLYMMYFRHRQRPHRLMIGMAIVSFAISEALVQTYEPVAFFIAPSRFWQFLVGAIIAVKPLQRIVSKNLLDVIALSGLGMILYSIFTYSGQMAFPGIGALLPTLGTAMVIFAGQEPGLVTSKLLSISPARFFGKISYSLYLWHWPLIVFYKLEIKPEPSSDDRLFLIGMSILLGYLSWKFIENPVRHIQLKRARFSTLSAGALATVLVSCIGLAFVATDGGRERYTEEQLTYIDYLSYDADPFYRTDTCFLTSQSDGAEYFDKSICLSYHFDKPNVLLVGDSHGAQYYYALKESMPSIEFSQVNASGCRPLMNYEGADRCTTLMRMAFEQYVNEYEFDAIILAGRWENDDLPAMAATVERLSQDVGKVIVLGPIIEYQQALPRLLARHGDEGNDLEKASYFNDVERIDQELQGILDRTRAAYYSILNVMCPDKACQIYTSDGMPIQFDASHLTHQGALEVVQRLKEEGMLQGLRNED